ncbi:MAG: NBR1-Ig-like domain-containing protein, partial [Acidobacteriota bacterium]|nr:NBR1-Ig-like domain-containing protein [Acidobacteriota bacterium]
LSQAGGHLDFVTHHAYDSSGNGGVTAKLTATTLFGDVPGLWDVEAPSTREVLLAAGWFGKPFWLTETGWQSAKAGESGQAAYLTGMLDDWFTGQQGQTWIDKIFFYEVKDPVGPNAPSYGLLNADGSPKRAYFAYQGFIAGQQPAPSDNAQLTASDIPKTMEAGQAVTVSLTFKNTGTSTWTAASAYELGAGGDNDPFASARQLLDAADSVAPGQQKTFTFVFTAPAAPGTYTTRWQMLREGGARFGDELSQQVTVGPAPAVQDRTLQLLGGRFSVGVSWHDPQSGSAGFGRAIPGSDETGTFWFFSAANTELVVKALDGRPLNRRFWFFYGALSDVEYWITVTDRVTGAVQTYHNPSGNLCGRGDTSAFAPAGSRSAVLEGGAAAELFAPKVAAPSVAGGPAAGGVRGGVGRWLSVPLPELSQLPQLRGGTQLPEVPEFLELPESIEPRTGLASAAAAATPSGSCVPSPQNLCLIGNRFQVSVDWQTGPGVSGSGTASAVSDQTGTFWFFDPRNVELVVKVLDGRALTGKFWFFYGALSDVRYDITLTDTVTGSVKRYHNRQGNLCGMGDTSALD